MCWSDHWSFAWYWKLYGVGRVFIPWVVKLETWAIAAISASSAAQQVDEADGWRSSVGSPRRSAAAYLSRCAAYISGGDSSLKVLCWWQEVRHRWIKIMSQFLKEVLNYTLSGNRLYVLKWLKFQCQQWIQVFFVRCMALTEATRNRLLKCAEIRIINRVQTLLFDKFPQAFD